MKTQVSLSKALPFYTSAFRLIGQMLLLAAILTGFSGRAAILGNYPLDSNTLHLWHLNETTTPAIDSAANGTNLTFLGGSATLNNPSFSGYGTALNTTGGTGNYLAARALANSTADDTTMTYADATTGAFTIEAIIRADFDPATFNRANVPLYLVCGENEAGNRPWQFRIHTNGAANSGTFILSFLNTGVSGGLTATIPTSGPDALVRSNWYHVAATFTGGTPGTVKLFWTLLDPTRTQATELASGTMANLNPLATGNIDFSIGNVGRTTPNGNFVGLIDEVRISKIARLATDMVFGVANSAPTITANPVNQIVSPGQTASFAVSAIGTPPLFYFWRTNGVLIPGATNDHYNISSAQLADAASYDVVVSNAVNSVLSSAATLTVRNPINLSWIGSGGLSWDTNTFNWDSNGDAVADVAFTPGDNVRFDDAGVASPAIDVTGFFNPNSVVISNNVFDYVLTTSGSGGIVNTGGLTKSGTGSVLFDIDNSYSGPTVIEAGTVVVGSAGGRGSLGSGPVTNNGTLRYDRTGIATINSLSGSGVLVLDNSVTLNLPGLNAITGSIMLNKGSLTVGTSGVGSITNLSFVGVGAGNGTSLTLNDSIIPSGALTTMQTSDPDNRTYVVGGTGSNVWNAPITLTGTKSAGFNAVGGSLLVNGPVSGSGFTDFFTLRGNANAVLAANVNLPNGKLQKTDGNVWTITSTGNSYVYTRMLGGTLKLGVNNGLATNGFLINESGASTFDLAGFNQTLIGLTNVVSSGIILNSSTNSDSRLTILTSDGWTYGGSLAGTPGSTKLSLTLNGGGSLTLSNANTYYGDTTIAAGTLGLTASGSIANSFRINMAAGTALDASGKTDGTLTVGTAQTLAGTGTVSIAGNLVNNGTIELSATKAGATLSNGRINVSGAISYGGTLKLNLTASPPLTTSDSFKLFDGTGYSGSFTAIIPSVPASGLAWNVGTLATDGTLRITTGPATNPTNIVFSIAGGNTLQLSWPSDHTGFTLQAQTNSLNAGLGTNWFAVPGSMFTNQIFIPINQANGSVFYRLTYP